MWLGVGTATIYWKCRIIEGTTFAYSKPLNGQDNTENAWIIIDYKFGRLHESKAQVLDQHGALQRYERLADFLFGFEIMQNSFPNPTTKTGPSARASIATAAPTSSKCECSSATSSTAWGSSAKLPPMKYQLPP